MSRMIRELGLLSLVALVLGCGVAGEAPVRVTPPAPDAKETLQQIAGGSSLKALKQQLYQEIEGLREAQPEKAAELMADFEKLVQEKDPTAIQAQASMMAEKL